MTAPSDAEHAASRGEERLKARNRYEWIGVAHNKMLDDFRSDLRRPGTLSKNLCDYVGAFSMNEARIPVGRPRSPDNNWRAVEAVIDSSQLCSAKRRLRLSSGFAPYTFVAPVVEEPSRTALALLGQIDMALSVATSARDLANRFFPILDSAQGLSELEQAIVSATVSVAQNSFVYWSSQYPLFEAEAIAEYSPCIEEQLVMGNDRITDTCFIGKGSGGAVASIFSPDKGASQRLVRTRSRRTCGPSIKEGFRHIASADARGAWVGGFSGGLAGGLAGAVAGALAGGGGNSVFAAAENAWKTLKCMYGVT
ncbi:MAG TPA: hypothetical protein VEB19_15060 [Gemmatimonadaceae bacterium]|nr:hypothetical protein [Gemmatimonadaceae bacterium]